MSHPIFEVQSLSKKYRQDKKTIVALDEVSLTVEPRDIYGIIGLSGAGKSTLMRSLSRLILPSSGKVLFHGKDLAGFGRSALRQFRQKTGMIFQQFNLLSS